MNYSLLRNLMLCACIGSVSFAQPLAAQADRTPAPPQAAQSPSPAQKKAKRKAYKGRIETFDPAARTVTIRKATTSRTFKVADDAKFATSDSENASLAPLKEGDLVNVRFTEEGNVAIAHHIGQVAKKQKPSP